MVLNQHADIFAILVQTTMFSYQFMILNLELKYVYVLIVGIIPH